MLLEAFQNARGHFFKAACQQTAGLPGILRRRLITGHGVDRRRSRFVGQLNRPADPTRFRGGYVEEWTVFWITAHFLTAAAKFEEMGVLDEIWDAP